MQLEMFINFNGNCRQAIEFYEKVFKSKIGNLMTYADAPQDPAYPLKDADRDRIMYAGIPFKNMTLMFMDMPSDSPANMGDNINPTISVDDKNEVTCLFNQLKEGGLVYMEPQKTFFSEWYAMVKDKFGVIWQILHYTPQG